MGDLSEGLHLPPTCLHVYFMYSVDLFHITKRFGLRVLRTHDEMADDMMIIHETPSKIYKWYTSGGDFFLSTCFGRSDDHLTLCSDLSSLGPESSYW